MYVQNIGLSNQFIFKYDVFDPNKDLSADQIGIAANRSSASDVKYTTIGLGWVHHWDSNVKFVLYYDLVKNEEVANLSSLKSDLKDNVITFRMQYKF